MPVGRSVWFGSSLGIALVTGVGVLVAGQHIAWPYPPPEKPI